MKKEIEKAKYYGAGIEWTEEIEREGYDYLHDLPVFEAIPENFFNPRYFRKEFLNALKKIQTPTLLHGVETSIGSPEPLKQQHIDRIKWVADNCNCIEISDHLCMTEAGGWEIGQLTPVPYTQDVADMISEKIIQIQKQINVPYAIENITNLFYVPDCELSETEFTNRILHNTGCGFLFDITNTYTNSVNHGFDPYKWIDEIDLDHLVTIHLAGGVTEDGWLIDSHSQPVPDPVWDLFKYTIQKTGPVNTIFEWTNDVTSIEDYLADAKKAQMVLDQLNLKTSHVVEGVATC